MTKGTDVKQLYSKLGLQPEAYQEVRAEEEVMQSIEERWPLLRDLLESLAKSLEPEGATAVPPVTPVHATPSAAPDAAEDLTSLSPAARIGSSAPAAPDWLGASHATPPPISTAPVAPPVSGGQERSQERSQETSHGRGKERGESLAERLERLYGDTAQTEEAGGEPAAERIPEEKMPEITAPEKAADGVTPSAATSASSDVSALYQALGSSARDERDFDEQEQDDVEPAPKPVVEGRTGKGLLGRLLARPVEPEPPASVPEESDASDFRDDEGQHSEDWGLADEHPPPIDLGATAPADRNASAAGEPDLGAIISRLAPRDTVRSAPEVASTPAATPSKRDLKSTFARLKRGPGAN